MENGIKMIRGLGVSLGGLVFVASQGFPEETWLPISNTLD